MDLLSYIMAKSYCKKYLTLGSTYRGLLLSSDSIPSSGDVGDYYICDFDEVVVGIGNIIKGNIIIWNGASWDRSSFVSSSGLNEDITSTVKVGASNVGTLFTRGMGLTDYIKLVHIATEPPTITMTSTEPFTNVYEKGDGISANITTTVSKVSNDLASITYSSNPTDANFTGARTLQGTTSFVETVGINISDSNSYTVNAIDIEGLTSTKTSTFTFVYPIYVGILDPSTTDITLDMDEIINTGTKLIATKGTRTVTYNSLNQYAKFYIAYPTSYGNLSHVVDVANNIDITSGCAVSTRTTTCLDGTNQSYTIVYPTTTTKYDNTQIRYSW